MTKQCSSGKKRYTGPQQAEEVLHGIWSRARPGRRLETRSYLCPGCNGWHLTSQPSRPVPSKLIELKVEPEPVCACCMSRYLPVLHNARCASGLDVGGCGHRHAQHLAARRTRPQLTSVTV